MQEETAAPAATGEVSIDIDAMTDKQFETWRETGELPKPEQSGDDTSEAAGEAGESESAEESDTSDEGQDEQPKKFKGGFQKKIDKLTREKRELESRLSAVEGRLAGDPAVKAPEQPKQEAAPEKPSRPKASDYNSYAEFEAAEEKYLEDLTDWKTDQKIAKVRAESQREATQRQARERASATMSQWQERVAAAAEKHPDFAEVTSAEVEVTPAMQQAIVESEQGAEIAYYLGKHPEVAERIASLSSPLAQVRELGKLEATLTPVTTKTPKTSKAPEPLKPVAGGKSSVDLDDPNLAYSDWEKRREAQLRRSR